MLTGAFTAGRMAAPEHLSPRDRVILTNDHLAVTMTRSTSQSTCQAALREIGGGPIVTSPAPHLTRPTTSNRTGRMAQAVSLGFPLAASVPRSDVTDA
jgi:hypothetical protein